MSQPATNNRYRAESVDEVLLIRKSQSLIDEKVSSTASSAGANKEVVEVIQMFRSGEYESNKASKSSKNTMNHEQLVALWTSKYFDILRDIKEGEEVESSLLEGLKGSSSSEGSSDLRFACMLAEIQLQKQSDQTERNLEYEELNSEVNLLKRQMLMIEAKVVNLPADSKLLSHYRSKIHRLLRRQISFRDYNGKQFSAMEAEKQSLEEYLENFQKTLSNNNNSNNSETLDTISEGILDSPIRTSIQFDSSKVSPLKLIKVSLQKKIRIVNREQNLLNDCININSNNNSNNTAAAAAADITSEIDLQNRNKANDLTCFIEEFPSDAGNNDLFSRRESKGQYSQIQQAATPQRKQQIKSKDCSKKWIRNTRETAFENDEKECLSQVSENIEEEARKSQISELSTPVKQPKLLSARRNSVSVRPSLLAALKRQSQLPVASLSSSSTQQQQQSSSNAQQGRAMTMDEQQFCSSNESSSLFVMNYPSKMSIFNSPSTRSHMHSHSYSQSASTSSSTNEIFTTPKKPTSLHRKSYLSSSKQVCSDTPDNRARSISLTKSPKMAIPQSSNNRNNNNFYQSQASSSQIYHAMSSNQQDSSIFQSPQMIKDQDDLVSIKECVTKLDSMMKSIGGAQCGWSFGDHRVFQHLMKKYGRNGIDGDRVEEALRDRSIDSLKFFQQKDLVKHAMIVDQYDDMMQQKLKFIESYREIKARVDRQKQQDQAVTSLRSMKQQQQSERNNHSQLQGSIGTAFRMSIDEVDLKKNPLLISSDKKSKERMRYLQRGSILSTPVKGNSSSLSFQQSAECGAGFSAVKGGFGGGAADLNEVSMTQELMIERRQMQNRSALERIDTHEIGLNQNLMKVHQAQQRKIMNFMSPMTNSSSKSRKAVDPSLQQQQLLIGNAQNNFCGVPSSFKASQDQNKFIGEQEKYKSHELSELRAVRNSRSIYYTPQKKAFNTSMPNSPPNLHQLR